MSAYAIPVSTARNPRRTATRSAPRALQRRLALAQVAVALLFVLAAGDLGYRLFGPGDPEHPGGLPVAVAPAGSPSPSPAADDALLAVALPAELLPRSGFVTGSLHHSTIPGGSTTAWTAELRGCCPGIRIDYVLQGSYVVFAAGPVQVVRAGGNGNLEAVPGDTEIRLDPGDALIFPNQAAVEYTNRWASEAELLTWVLYDSRPALYPGNPIPAGWTVTHTTLRPDQPFASGPATLRLRRIELAAATTFPTARDVLQFGVLSSERVAGASVPRDVAGLGDGSFRNFGAGPVIVYVMTLTPAGPAP